MSEPTSAVKLIFRVHLIQINRSGADLTIRILLVETTGAKAVYEGLELWTKFRCLFDRLLSVDVTGEELAVARKLLDRKRFATLHGVRASPQELELLGFERVDS